MVSEDIRSLVELVTLALPAYALVLKTIADQPTRYPRKAVRGLAAAIWLVLLAGIVLVGEMIAAGLRTPGDVGAGLVIASFLAMMYAVWHFRDRQEELEEDPDDEDDPDAEKQPM